MFPFKKPFIILFILILSVACFVFYKSSSTDKDENTTIVNHHMVVEKISQIGKLEVVKFYIKDVVEHTEVKEWWPDAKVALIVCGEVAGCIDLKKIDSTDISVSETEVSIRLPQPEICYYKINHNESKVYNIQYEYFEKSALIDKAYQIAEKEIEKAAVEMKILDQTKTAGVNLLRPMLENFSGKKVVLTFK